MSQTPLAPATSAQAVHHDERCKGAASGWVVAALYQFHPVADPAGLHSALEALCQRLGLCGTLIVAAEGINGTVAGTRAALDELRGFLHRSGFDRLEYKESHSSTQPFAKLKIKQKAEIVTFGVPVSPRSLVGHHVEPQAWNALLNDPDVLVIDTRNDYEVQAGSFAGAINPHTRSFREFPAWAAKHLDPVQHKKIAMFCTGGIRCEKSTSHLLAQGFEEVYHLKGGVLNYLENIPAEHSRWQGECFVFDERVTVGHGVQAGPGLRCEACGWPLEVQDIHHPQHETGVSCRHCHDQTSDQQKAGFRQRMQQRQQP